MKYRHDEKKGYTTAQGININHILDNNNMMWDDTLWKHYL